MWTAWIRLRKCGILSSSGSCPCLEKFSLGLNRNKTANIEEATEIQKGPTNLLEKCKEIFYTPTPKDCFLSKVVPLQTLSMGKTNNFKLRRKITFKVILVYLGEIAKVWSIISFNMERDWQSSRLSRILPAFYFVKGEPLLKLWKSFC